MVLSLRGAVRFIVRVWFVQIVIGILLLFWNGIPEGKELFFFLFSFVIPLILIEIICSAERWSKKEWIKDYAAFTAIFKPRFIINLYKKDPSEPDGEALINTSVAMQRFVVVCVSGCAIPITIVTFFEINNETYPYFFFGFAGYLIIFWLIASYYYRKQERRENSIK